jgi:outer membrane protein OmpA-like peptidoglycan-associated protein
MKINRLGSVSHRHLAGPGQDSTPAGSPAYSRNDTAPPPGSAGIHGRILSRPPWSLHDGPGRAGALGLVAVTALSVLAGCMPASRASAPDAVVVAATATANEPAPVLSSADATLLRAIGESAAPAVAFVVDPATGRAVQLPLTPRRADGQVEYGPQRFQLLTQNVSRIGSRIGGEAATGPFDLLNTMLTASRVTPSPATMLLLTSGVTTSGGFDLRKVGWAEPPAQAAAALRQRGLLPNLAGWTVIFSGLGVTAARQPALPLPQQTTLASYWLAICHVAGAAACRVDDSPRPVRGSRSTVPVPVVPVPVVQSITGPDGKQQSIIPADLLFAFGSAALLPAADTFLVPIAARARAGRYTLSITGQASPDGGSAPYNLRLSALRAQAVERRIITLGLAADQIAQVTGIGTDGRSCTAGGALDESKCAKLRRVVITLTPATAAS